MAAGTIILRPSADISVNHELYPNGSTSAYILINEETADNAATYISCKTTNDEVYNSSFKMSGTIPSSNIEITGCRFINRYAYYCTGTATLEDTITLTIGNSSTSTTYNANETSSASAYTTYNATFSNADSFLTELNNYIKNNGAGELSNISLSLSNSLSVATNSKDYEAVLNITQLYLELDYEEITPANIGIHYKSNGSWLTATKVFHKVNGSWVEITASECRNLLQN